MKPSTFRREWALMVLPVLLLIGLGLWAQMRPLPVAPQPTPTPGPFRLEVVEFKELPLTPYEVFLGADTKVRIEVVTAGSFLGANPLGTWTWADTRSLGAPNSDLPVYDEDGYLQGAQVMMEDARLNGSNEQSISSDGSARFAKILLLRLREVPADRGELELQWSLALGANVWAAPGQSQESKIAGLKANGRAPTAMARLVVRRADEKIALPVVSKNPNFEVSQLTLLPSIAAARTQPVRVALSFTRFGSSGKAGSASVKWQWDLVEADGRTPRSYLSSPIEVRLSGKQGKIEQKLNIADVLKTSTPNNRKPVILRGTISIDGAWPKIVEIPIP